jgi:DNA-binding PadR family transcriptional regulator
MNNIIVRDVFLAFVRVHILHHAANERIFGLEMIEELRRHGYSLSPGTLYPILHAMQEAGLLTSRHETVRGKVRKYYAATAKGRRALAEAREKIAELVEEVLQP